MAGRDDFFLRSRPPRNRPRFLPKLIAGLRGSAPAPKDGSSGRVGSLSVRSSSAGSSASDAGSGLNRSLRGVDRPESVLETVTHPPVRLDDRELAGDGEREPGPSSSQGFGRGASPVGLGITNEALRGRPVRAHLRRYIEREWPSVRAWPRSSLGSGVGEGGAEGEAVGGAPGRRTEGAVGLGGGERDGAPRAGLTGVRREVESLGCRVHILGSDAGAGRPDVTAGGSGRACEGGVASSAGSGRRGAPPRTDRRHSSDMRLPAAVGTGPPLRGVASGDGSGMASLSLSSSLPARPTGGCGE